MYNYVYFKYVICFLQQSAPVTVTFTQSLSISLSSEVSNHQRQQHPLQFSVVKKNNKKYIIKCAFYAYIY
jgi:hypothetical protein